MKDVSTPALLAQDLVDRLRRALRRHEEGETTLRQFLSDVDGMVKAHDRRALAEGRGATLGTVVVDCGICGQPRQMEVRGRVSTVERPGWSGFKGTWDGQEIGRLYMNLYTVRADDHSCVKKAPEPRHGLRAI